jgi:anti-anti-sigma factor
MMKISTEKWRDWTVLSIEGRFTLRYFTAVRPSFETLWETPGAKIALDLSRTRLVDSSAITLLVNFREKLDNNKGKMVILEPNEDIRLVFSVIEFEKSVPIYHTRAEFERDVDQGTL